MANPSGRHGFHSREILRRPDGRFDLSIGDHAPASLPSPHDPATAQEFLRFVRWPGHITIFEAAVSHTFEVPDPLAGAVEATGGGDSMRAPMPGLVKAVKVGTGEKVRRSQPLLVLEAMKMEHTIVAPHDGTVAEIAREGAQVTDGTVLVRFAEAGD